MSVPKEVDHHKLVVAMVRGWEWVKWVKEVKKYKFPVIK